MRLRRHDLERAAAEILDLQVYTLWANELPPGHWRRGDTAMCLRCAGDADYRELIGPRWTGRGACVVISLDVLRAEAEAFQAAWPRVGTRERFRCVLLSTFAHELTHVVRDCIVPRRDAPVPPPTDRLRRMHEALADAGVADSLALGGSVPFRGHDAQFLRTTAHIAYRIAESLGHPFHLLFYTEAISLSPSWHYLVALDDEPARLRHVPLTEIDDHDPPEAFRHLWCHDVRRWWRRLDSPTDAQTQAMIRGVTLFPVTL